MDDDMEARIAMLEKATASLKKRSGWLAVCTIVLGLLSAAITLTGHWWLFTSAAQAQAIQRQGQDIQRLGQDIERGEIREKQLLGLQGDYARKKHVINTIATVYGAKMAIEVEGPFRSGATIRALEDFSAKRPDDKDRIDKSLNDVKTVMFIDSKNLSNVYCPDSQKSSGTNIDDIVEIIKDFPVRIAARKGDDPDQGIENTLLEMDKEHPNVIVVHLGAFADETPQGEKNDVSKMKVFLQRIFKDKKYAPSVVLYSRKSDQLVDVKTSFAADKVTRNKIATVQMDPGGCFRANSPNGIRIEAAIRRAVEFDSLYTRKLVAQ